MLSNTFSISLHSLVSSKTLEEFCDERNEMMKYDGPDIHFSDAEVAGLPKADEILPKLILVAKKCYNTLNSLNRDFSNHESITHFIHSADCAMQIIQHIEREGNVDYGLLCATIDIPGIDETLPLMVTIFETFKSNRTGPHSDYLNRAMYYIEVTGTKMYPGGLDEDGVQGYRDIFDDDGGFSSLIRLYP